MLFIRMAVMKRAVVEQLHFYLNVLFKKQMHLCY